MSEMVERVARALAAGPLDAGGTKRDLGWWDDPAQSELRAALLSLARAAIGAMRKPTDAMVQTVRCARPYDMDITELWPIAIDEALR